MENLEAKLDCVEKNLENIESLEDAVIYAAIDVFNYCSNIFSRLKKRGVKQRYDGICPIYYTAEVIRIVQSMVEEGSD